MRKKIKRNIEKNVAEIIFIIIIVLTISSCSTARDMTMSKSKRMTQCAWFNCN